MSVAEQAPAKTPELDWPVLLEAAWELPGNTHNTYRRGHQYSFGNLALFMYQGITPQPVGTYKWMQSMGRQVRRGEKAAYVLRPITIKLHDQLDETGNPKQILKFKLVRAIFALEQTDGDPLPDLELPLWSRQRAMNALGITEVPFEHFDSNTQGYSYDRNISINPLAAFPEKTFFHEVSHVQIGHTAGDHEDYRLHRGTYEGEAESTSHIVMNELDLMTPEAAEVSRGYLQSWTRGKRLGEQSVRRVFKAADQIVSAGRDVDHSTTPKD